MAGNKDVMMEQKVSLETRGFRVIRNIMEVNYFYVCSAILMMLGCYLLMRSPIIRGTVFTRTLWTLVILQAYEVLVIATAIFIVHHLTKLGDALTLLIIELVLLLDPTFFSNSFFTMLRFESTMVNVVCFGLVPIKLLILQRFLRIRLTPVMFVAFMFAAFFVYIMEGPLSAGSLPISFDAYYYLLCWMPFVLAFLLPPLTKMVSITSPDAGFITKRQQMWLPNFLMILPMVTVAAHFIESSQVHTQITFYWVYGAPLLLSLSILIINNADRSEIVKKLATIDVMVIIALILSIGPINIQGKHVIHATGTVGPLFLRANITLSITATAVCIIYILCYHRFQYKPALYRIAAIASLGAIYLIYSSGIVQLAAKTTGHAAGTASKGIGSLFAWLGHHLSLLYVIILVVAIFIARFLRELRIWFIVGVYSLVVLFYFLPLRSDRYVPEIAESAFALLAILYHLFNYPRKERYTAAFVVIAIALGRFIADPAFWSSTIVAGTLVGLFFFGIALKHRGYVTLGAIASGVFIIVLLSLSRGKIPSALISVTCALILFVIGVVVTFNKKTILMWLQNWATASRAAAIASAKTAPLSQQVPFQDRLPDAEVKSDETGLKIEKAEDKKKPPEELLIEEEEQRKPPAVSPIPEKPKHMEPEAPERLEKTHHLLQALFITEPEANIFLAQDMTPDALESILQSLPVAPGEVLEVCISEEDKPTDWKALLTNQRMILREKEKYEVLSISYKQIAKVTRELRTVYVTGHAGQILSCQIPSVYQAIILKKGTESLLAELASDKMESPDG